MRIYNTDYMDTSLFKEDYRSIMIESKKKKYHCIIFNNTCTNKKCDNCYKCIILKRAMKMYESI